MIPGSDPTVRLHPAVRILSLVAFILCLAGGGWSVLVAAALLVSMALASHGSAAFRRFLLFSWRLRWFFLSILVLFGWFTPGTPLFEVGAAIAPSREGLVHGAERAAVILLIVAGVVWLLETSTREELVRGLLWLTAPLARLGFPHERFAVRLTLVLAAVPELRGLVDVRARRPTDSAGKLQRWMDAAAELFRAALNQAERAPLGALELATTAPPRTVHWLSATACIGPLALLAWWRPF